MARQLRVPIESLQSGESWLEADAAHYVMRVHRLTAGDAFVAFDASSQMEAEGQVLEVAGKRVRCRLGPLRTALLISPLAVTLVQGLGKGDKLDQVVRDATELGARRIIAALTARCTSRPEEHEPKKQRRWETIALQAARQCGRGDVPQILGPVGLLSAVRESPPGRRLMLHGEAKCGLLDALDGWAPSEPLTLLVGPEGGFSSEETALLEAEGCQSAVLGPFTLRTETAATAALGVVLAISRLMKTIH